MQPRLLTEAEKIKYNDRKMGSGGEGNEMSVL